MLNEVSIYKTMFSEYNDIVTVSEFEKMLGISHATANKIIQENQIKSFRIGNLYRIPKLAVIEYVLKESSYTDIDFGGWISKTVSDMLGVADGEIALNY